MTSVSDTQSWDSSGYPELAEVWIRDVLARHSIAVNGKIAQPHVRPWSAVFRVPTNRGAFYFKAVNPVLGFEPALTLALAHWRTDCTPIVLEIDADEGWMLMADGGRTLREAFRAGLDMAAWHAVLAQYAGLQIDLSSNVDDLLALGVRDRRLDMLPQLYRDLLQDQDWLLFDQPDGLTSREYQRLVDAAPFVEDACRALAAFSVPHSLHHNDLHDGNVFAENGRYRIFDWGDSSVSHPFFSLRTVFVSMENTFGLAEDDPVFDTFARSYLRQWARYEPETNLWHAYELARNVWALSSAVKYWTILRGLRQDAREYGRAVPGLLREFLEAGAA